MEGFAPMIAMVFHSQSMFNQIACEMASYGNKRGKK